MNKIKALNDVEIEVSKSIAKKLNEEIEFFLTLLKMTDYTVHFEEQTVTHDGKDVLVGFVATKKNISINFDLWCRVSDLLIKNVSVMISGLTKADMEKLSVVIADMQNRTNEIKITQAKYVLFLKTKEKLNKKDIPNTIKEMTNVFSVLK